MKAALLGLMLMAAGVTSAAAQQPGTQVMASENGQVDAAYTATIRPGQDPNERVCRSIAYTGSRLGAERVCHTRQEWQELSERARERTNDVVNGGLRNGCQTGGTGGCGGG